MNGLPEGRRGHMLALGICLLIVAAVYLLVIAPLSSLYGSGAERLETRRDCLGHVIGELNVADLDRAYFDPPIFRAGYRECLEHPY